MILLFWAAYRIVSSNPKPCSAGTWGGHPGLFQQLAKRLLRNVSNLLKFTLSFGSCTDPLTVYHRGHIMGST